MAMLQKIATRQGIGDILANGIVEAKDHFSPEASRLAIYTKKGNTPRAHDHRACWRMMLDTCVSDTGTDEASSFVIQPGDVGLPGDADLFSAEVTGKLVARAMDRAPFDDCLIMCRFNNRGVNMEYLAEIVKAVAGWDFTGEEASKLGYRVVNLLRTFNIRHGLTADLDMPSIRYGSAPIDGPFQGITIEPVWEKALKYYYESMGWDVETGKPLPQTLTNLGLPHLIKDIW
jgi:aldehyde:ferredoxin oxidoreductase